MALNKFMHPRNIYKNPPDFAKLAKSFEDFSNIVKLDVTGKVTINFKDPHSLRVLTKCLLKSDFNLDVTIPEDRLVPTLPLRLNYILWIEDLLNSIHRTDGVWGIDIGTGACAIYPLLAATKNKWHMVGTETDQQSLMKAQENVNKNNLQELIEVRRNPTESVLEHMFYEENIMNYDFCMCNPPFYSNMEELCESRSPARLPPKNGFTGSPQELITEGGELAFCRKMIKESKDHKNKVLIFTTMVGHKYNMSELVQDLKAEGIKYTTMEFCQGRVTRWGLAWTYQDYDLCTLVPGRDKPRKKTLPISYVLPALPSIPYDLETVSNKIKNMLHDLKIEYKILNKRGNNLTMDVKAFINTWSNQRRKRRLTKRSETDEFKKPKLDQTSNSVKDTKRLETDESIKPKLDETSNSNTNNDDRGTKRSETDTFKQPKLDETSNSNTNNDDRGTKRSETDTFKKPKLDETSNSNTNNDDKDTTDCTNTQFEYTTLKESKINGCSDKDVINDTNLNSYNEKQTVGQKVERDSSVKEEICVSVSNVNEDACMSTSTATEPSNYKLETVKSTCAVNQNIMIENKTLVHAFLKLMKKDKEIILEMEFLSGTAGKEGLHQIVQYIKNHWKYKLFHFYMTRVRSRFVCWLHSTLTEDWKNPHIFL